MKFRFKKGLEATDIISGYTGIIAYRVDFITGCAQYGLQPMMNEKDRESHILPKREQFDENSLEITGRGLLSEEDYQKWLSKDTKEQKELAKKEEKAAPGGPQRMA